MVERGTDTAEAGDGSFGLSESADSSTWSKRVGINFRQYRWLGWELSVSRNDRDSDIGLLDYNERLIELRMSLTL